MCNDRLAQILELNSRQNTFFNSCEIHWIFMNSIETWLADSLLHWKINPMWWLIKTWSPKKTFQLRGNHPHRHRATARSPLRLLQSAHMMSRRQVKWISSPHAEPRTNCETIRKTCIQKLSRGNDSNGDGEGTIRTYHPVTVYWHWADQSYHCTLLPGS